MIFFFFIWEAVWKGLLTIGSLKRRGWTLVNRYFLCKGEDESCDHILHRSKAILLWWLVFFSLFGVVWVLYSSVKAMVLSWYGLFIRKKREKRRKVWNVCHLCLFWTIWKEINGRAFENVGLSYWELKFSFLCNFLKWTKRGLGLRSCPCFIVLIGWVGSSCFFIQKTLVYFLCTSCSPFLAL